VSEKDFLLWRVKPIWRIAYPSQRIGTQTDEEVIIYGVDRGGLEISRNWGKIHSVEEFNQGFVAMPQDFRITIAVKEHGDAYELLKRLGMGVMFDIRCDILRSEGDLSEEYAGSFESSDYVPWMKGYEEYIGCMIQREGQTVDIGAFPVREFEIEFLRRKINPPDEDIPNPWNTKEIEEGAGTFPSLEELGLSEVHVND